MKKVMFSFIIIASAIGMAAQAPLSFSYQAVIRDAGGSVMAEEPVTVGIILRQSTADGFPVYTESHSTRTNTLGLVNLKIGEGSTADDFSSIDWSDGPYFLELSVNGIEMGTSQLLSVPYALYAGRSGDGFSGDYGDLSNAPDLSGYLTTETDPVFTGHSASGITSTAISNWNAAFGWGNHAGLYRLASYVPDWSDITGKPALAQVAVTGSYTDLNDIPAVFTPDVHTHPESDITDLRHYSDADIDGNEIAFNGWDKNASDDFDGDYNSLQNTPDLSQYLVSESDPVFSGHPSGSITLTDLDNWTRAFGWGDHSAEGYFRNGGETAGVDRTIGNIDSFALSFITDNTDRLYIDSRGHVGIGTQLPGNQLSVNGSADINTALQTPKLLPLSGDGNSLAMQTNHAYSGSGSLTIRTGNTTNTGGINSTGAITIETGSLSNNGGSTGTVTIRAGRSTNYAYDGSQLIVGGYPGGNGGGGLSLYSGNGWAGAGSILMKAGDAGWGPGGNITLQSGSGGGQAGSGSNIILNTGNDADAGPGSIMLQINGAEHMRMNQSGNVGIGTANPTAKLEVAGGVKVGSNGTRFTELFELTGTTVASGQISTITLPEGWTADNSRVLNIEVQHTGNLYWLGVANFMINQETSYLIKDDYITLYLPNDTYLNSAPYRVLLMKLE